MKDFKHIDQVHWGCGASTGSRVLSRDQGQVVSTGA